MFLLTWNNARPRYRCVQNDSQSAYKFSKKKFLFKCGTLSEMLWDDLFYLYLRYLCLPHQSDTTQSKPFSQSNLQSFDGTAGGVLRSSLTCFCNVLNCLHFVYLLCVDCFISADGNHIGNKYITLYVLSTIWIYGCMIQNPII